VRGLEFLDNTHAGSVMLPVGFLAVDQRSVRDVVGREWLRSYHSTPQE